MPCGRQERSGSSPSPHEGRVGSKKNKDKKEHKKEKKHSKKAKLEHRGSEGGDEEACRITDHLGERDRKVDVRAAKLMREAAEGLVLKVEKRISKDPDLLRAADHAGRSALHVACSAGTFQTCLLLVRRQADVNLRDTEGNTPLHAATMACKWDVAEMLLNRGAHMLTNIAGKTAGELGLDGAMTERRAAEEKRVAEHEKLRIGRKETAARLEKERAETAERIRVEREWQEKMMDEQHFEYLEGGWGSRGRGVVPSSQDGSWWEEADEKLDDEDWWEEMARRMRQKKGYHSGGAEHSKREGAARQGAMPGLNSRFHVEGEKMSWERGNDSAGGAASWASSVVLDTVEGFMARAAAHASAWEHFISLPSSGKRVTYNDVPWPVVPPGGDLASEVIMIPPAGLQGSSASEATRRKAVREALRRWHPDKFGQRFGSCVKEADHDRIMERVKAVSQVITALIV